MGKINLFGSFMIKKSLSLTKHPKTIFTTFLLIYLTFSMSEYRSDSVDHMILQLNGEHCDYFVDNHSWPIKCEFKGGGYSASVGRILRKFFSSNYNDCKCRGDAAVCLGIMGGEASIAVPHLTEYLVSGPSDYADGEGPWASCLSSVIEALGEIQDTRAIPSIVKYMEDPKRYNTGPNVDYELGKYTGLRSSIGTITKFDKEETKDAVEPLRYWLTRRELEFAQIKGEVIKTLRLLGDEKQIEDTEVNLGRLRDITLRPIDLSNSIEDYELEIVSATLWNLEEWIKEGNKKAIQKRLSLHMVLDIFENDVPAWRQNVNAWLQDDKDWKKNSFKTIEYKLNDIRRTTVRILARLADPRILPMLSDEFSADFHQEEWAPIALNYGEQIDVLIPEFIEHVTDLQYEDTPQCKRIDSSKINRAKIIIEILKQRNNTQSRDALEKIKKIKQLRYYIDGCQF